MNLSQLPVGTVIEFTQAINDFGAYAEKGIRGRVKEVEQRDSETLYMGFDYREFSDHNRLAATPGYGKEPNLRTASEAGVVPKSEGFCFDINQPADEFVEVISLPPSPAHVPDLLIDALLGRGVRISAEVWDWAGPPMMCRLPLLAYQDPLLARPGDRLYGTPAHAGALSGRP